MLFAGENKQRDGGSNTFVVFPNGEVVLMPGTSPLYHSDTIALDELFLPPNMGTPDITIPVGNVTYQD